MGKFNAVEVVAYETSDGLLFACERKANEHQADIVGALLDELLPHDDRGNITRIDRHNLLMKMLENDNLIKIINNLHNALKKSE